MPDWKAILNGSTVCGGDCADLDVDACLTSPPDGTGVPGLRTTDQAYPQRDGVDHFSDWYEPRILTFQATVGGAGCGCSGGARANARSLMRAWSRQCEDVELVLSTGCEVSDFPNLLPNGEFDEGITGWAGDNLTLAHETTVTHNPPGSLSATLDTSADGVAQYLDLIPVEAGLNYTFTGWGRSATSTLGWQLGLVWLDEDETPIGSMQNGGSTAITAAGWTQLDTVPARAPFGAVSAQLVIQSTIASGTPIMGDVYYFDTLALTEATTETVGPYGVIGRPRVATLQWRKGKFLVADSVLRFDSIDHRLYLLDADGTPGSGAQCVTSLAGSAVVPDVGDLCSPAIFTNDGAFANAMQITQAGGNFTGVGGDLLDTDVLVLDTSTGTATLNGVDVSNQIIGDPFLTVEPGETLTITGGADGGEVEVCFRPAVISA